MKNFVMAAVGLLALSMPAMAWELISREGSKGAFQVTNQTSEVVNVGYVFWQAGWKFAAANLTFGDKTPDGADAFQIAIPALGITGTGRISHPKPNVAVWTYEFNVEKELKGIIGGGLDGKLGLNSEGLQGHKADPVLLENKTGWKWEVGPGQFIEVKFAEPVEDVYFERGQKNTVRTMFFGKDVPAGKKTITMTVTLPEGATQVASPAERYGPTDTAKWFPGAMPADQAFIDLSYLNEKPAGKHGFVKAQGDQFVCADGTPLRFWGTNVQATSLFVQNKEKNGTDKALIDQQAKRLAQLGFNLVRLHHMDSGGWVNPNLIASGDTSQQFNPAAFDTYFYWIKALADNGIYVWVDLHVGRVFKEGDEIPGASDIFKAAKGKKGAGAEGKGFCYLNERIEELMKKFSEELVTKVNPYTGKAIKDDPAVMGMLLTNENDLTQHFGNSFLGDKGHPWHQKKFDALIEAFGKKYNLDPKALHITWLPGIAKIFLNELEYAWCSRMIEHLRTLGVKVPITSGHMWGGAMYSLPALTCSDMIDCHSYEGGEFLTFNPRFKPSSFNYFAACQLAGKPLTITEYNFGSAGVKDPFTIPLYIAGIGAFQGWDGPMMYGYSQDGFRGGYSPWSSYNLPHVMGLMPAAAVLFREGHVAPARETKFVQFTRETCFLQATSDENSKTLRTLMETHRLNVGLPAVAELPWLKATAAPAGAETVTDLTKDYIPAGQDFVQSDTGELKRDWVKGIFTINTPKTQAASGWLKGEKVTLGDAGFEITAPKATVALTSLDREPLSSSKKILLSTGARAAAPAKREGPILSEPVTGKITLRSRTPGLKLIPLKGDGTRGASIPLTQAEGVYGFEIPADQGTHWFLLAVD